MHAVIWMRRDVLDKGNNKAFHFSNMVTDGANPSPPIGDPNTYLTQTSQLISGVYNLQVLVRINSILYEQDHNKLCT